MNYFETRLTQLQEEEETLNRGLIDSEKKEERQEILSAIEKIKEERALIDEEIKNARDAKIDADKRDKEPKGGLRKIMGNEKPNYLATREASVDFLNILDACQKRGDFAEKWKSHLEARAVTGSEYFMPEGVLTVIKDFFDEYEGLLNYVSKNPQYAVDITSQTIRNFASGRADEDAAKTEKTFNFEQFTINVSEIYAAIKIGYKNQKLDKSTGSKMVDYIIRELVKSIVRGVERQIVLGTDATLPNLKGIMTETNTQLFETANIDLSAVQFSEKEVLAFTEGLEKISAMGAPIIVTTKEIARKLRSAKTPDVGFLDSNPLTLIKNGQNQILGYTTFTYDFMEGATNPIIAFAQDSYMLVGDSPTSPDFLQEYDIFPDNKGSYEAIGLVGGRLAEYKAAVKFVQGITG